MWLKSTLETRDGLWCRVADAAAGVTKRRRELTSSIERQRLDLTRRIVRICAALIASLAMTISASARLGMAPLNAEDGSLIQIKGGHGHGHGHHVRAFYWLAGTTRISESLWPFQREQKYLVRKQGPSAEDSPALAWLQHIAPRSAGPG
jgi:hypothetical protein